MTCSASNPFSSFCPGWDCYITLSRGVIAPTKRTEPFHREEKLKCPPPQHQHHWDLDGEASCQVLCRPLEYRSTVLTNPPVHGKTPGLWLCLGQLYTQLYSFHQKALSGESGPGPEILDPAKCENPALGGSLSPFLSLQPMTRLRSDELTCNQEISIQPLGVQVEH